MLSWKLEFFKNKYSLKTHGEFNLEQPQTDANFDTHNYIRVGQAAVLRQERGESFCQLSLLLCWKHHRGCWLAKVAR